MKLDHLTIDDIVACRDRINRYMKYRVLANCLFDAGIWRELFISRGMRTIAANYFRRHFTGGRRRNQPKPAADVPNS